MSPVFLYSVDFYLVELFSAYFRDVVAALWNVRPKNIPKVVGNAGKGLTIARKIVFVVVNYTVSRKGGKLVAKPQGAFLIK